MYFLLIKVVGYIMQFYIKIIKSYKSFLITQFPPETIIVRTQTHLKAIKRTVNRVFMFKTTNVALSVSMISAPKNCPDSCRCCPQVSRRTPICFALSSGGTHKFQKLTCTVGRKVLILFSFNCEEVKFHCCGNIL